jgi:hypothetical protein
LKIGFEVKRRYKEKRPIRLGAMQVQRTCYQEPSYKRALVSAGLMDENTKTESWDIWQAVCRDTVVIRLSMELERQRKIFLPSVAAPFQNGVQVLASMSEQQIAALKKRIPA